MDISDWRAKIMKTASWWAVEPAGATASQIVEIKRGAACRSMSRPERKVVENAQHQSARCRTAICSAL
jgi:hypothetical protein